MSDHTPHQGRVVELMASIERFHDRFHLPPPNVEELLYVLHSRIGLMLEEFGEHQKALNRSNLGHAIDEAVDMVYVTLGTLYMMDQAADGAVRAVVEKNDAKTLETHYFDPISGKVRRR